MHNTDEMGLYPDVIHDIYVFLVYDMSQWPPEEQENTSSEGRLFICI
jgi:hypothetical protein